MKILIVNKFFYNRGGDCIVAMATRRMLQAHGHEVRVFSMQHPQNLDIPDAEGYASAVDFGSGLKGKLEGMKRIFGKGDIVDRCRRVLDEFKPEIVHLHNIHSYLSPIIARMAHERGMAVVWTLHDYKLLCPAYCFRRPTGENCEECLHGNFMVAAHRCMKGSALQSAVAQCEAMYWSKKRLAEYTDLFIAPSRFMRNKMMEGGFSPSKIVTINNFIDPQKAHVFATSDVSEEREPYFCYVGRLSEEKGVETLLAAAVEAGVRLKIAGTGPLEADLKAKYAPYPEIEFLGHCDAAQVADLLLHATASVMPSEWYENNPLCVIESLCAGTPVIGAAIGGISDLIDPDTGVTFTSGNAEELACVMRDFGRRSPFNHRRISENALCRFSESTHYEALMCVYVDALEKKY